MKKYELTYRNTTKTVIDPHSRDVKRIIEAFVEEQVNLVESSKGEVEVDVNGAIWVANWVTWPVACNNRVERAYFWDIYLKDENAEAWDGKYYLD